MQEVPYLGANDISEVIKLPLNLGHGGSIGSYSIRVSWGDDNYTYNIKVKKETSNYHVIIDRRYSYKGQSYPSFEDFKTSILKWQKLKIN
jgi:hypothetical protein